MCPLCPRPQDRHRPARKVPLQYFQRTTSHVERLAESLPDFSLLNPAAQSGRFRSNRRLCSAAPFPTPGSTTSSAWLLSQDPSAFLKFTLLGTIWRGVDRHATDQNGQGEFMRAVINSERRLGLPYAAMLAEIADTDVNIQDELGRTALHRASVESLLDMVRLGLSVPDFATGLRDNDGLTAVDIALRTGNEFLPSLFYSSMCEINQSSPQVVLLRVLTLWSDETASVNQPLFPGEALCQPVGERNSPLVVALLDGAVVLTTKDEDGTPSMLQLARWTTSTS